MGLQRHGESILVLAAMMGSEGSILSVCIRLTFNMKTIIGKTPRCASLVARENLGKSFSIERANELYRSISKIPAC